ncbi:MAG TPA: hypothetical protein DF383_05060 [Deltaproteobacteria bacterium]|nr:hypothetical protein [Deltaproteobacteria bacterium]
MVVAEVGGLTFCYDFNGQSCAGTANIPITIAGLDPSILILSVRVADFNGDGKDDVAVIGYDDATYRGYLAVVAGTNAGGNNPLNPKAGDPTKAVAYYQQAFSGGNFSYGIPLAMAVGNFDSGPMPDIAVATWRDSSTVGGNVSTFLNKEGNGFGEAFAFNPGTTNFNRDFCDKPTGLLAYDADGVNQEDLVLTCYDRYLGCVTDPTGACQSTWASGPVVFLQNDGSGKSFATRQAIGEDDTTSLNYPYTSAVGDFNGDGRQDLAVASNGGSKVVTFPGTAPFQVDEAARNEISTLTYTPKYIQTQDMNGDGLPDLVLTAAGVRFPQGPVIAVNSPVSASGFDNYTRLRVKSDVAPGAYFQAESIDSLEAVHAGQFPDFSKGREFIQVSPEETKISFLPNAAGTYSEVLLAQSNPDLANTFIYGAIVERVPTDGVIVLLNHRPVISTDDPSCGGGTLNYRCTAAPGVTLTECKVETTDSTLTVSPAVAGPDGREWTGKVTLPNDQGVHKFTVISTDSLGNTVQSEVTVDYSKCPGPVTGGNQCPAKPIEKQILPKDPFMICAFENDKQLSGLNSGKTVTWSQVNAKGIELNTLNPQGQCLVGPRLPFNFESESEIELKYSVSPDGPTDCSARVVIPKASFQGSGNLGCSLGIGSVGTNHALSLLFGSMLLLPLGVRLRLRARSRS